MATLAERLTKVQDAIDAICDGAQSYSINGRTYTRGNLDQLMRLEASLQRRVNFEAKNRRRVSEM